MHSTFSDGKLTPTELVHLLHNQDVRIAAAIAAYPDIVLVIDRDTVIRCGPAVAVTWAAPVVHEIAVRIELEHVWRRDAAIRPHRVSGGADFSALVKRVTAMNDVDVISRIDADSNGRTEDPVIG